MAPKSDKCLLLFVHGLGGRGDDGTWGSFPALVQADPTLAARYDVGHFTYRTGKFALPLSKPIPKAREVARILKTEIETKHAQYTEIGIIAHSLGGLIARRYIADILEAAGPNRDAVDLKVKQLITFATPHIGAELANLAKFVVKGAAAVAGALMPVPGADKLIALSEQARDLAMDSGFQLALRESWGRTRAEHALRTKYVVAANDQIVSRTSSEGPQWSDDYDTVDGDHFTIVNVKDASHPSFVVARHFLTDDSHGHIAAPGPTYTQPRLRRPWADASEERDRFLYAARRTAYIEPVADMSALHAFRGPAKHMFGWMLATGPGGIGKSRTALEYLDAVGPRWYAGFFDPTDTKVDWGNWQPAAPTLIVGDYARRDARSRDGRVGLDRVIQALAARSTPATSTDLQLRHPVRLLLLERPGDHRWIDDDLKPSDSAVRSAIDATRIQGLLKNNTMNGLQEADIWRLIEDVFARAGRPPTRTSADTLAILRKIDPKMRPLFALFLADAMAAGRYERTWDAARLVEDVLRRERERWRAAVRAPDGQIMRAGPEERVLALATMTNGLDVGALPKARANAPLITWDEDLHRKLFAAMTGSTSDNRIAPLTPDIVGEHFVLEVIGEISQTQRAALRDAAWRLSPRGMSAFLERLYQDAPEALTVSGQPATTLLEPPVAFAKHDTDALDSSARLRWLDLVGHIHDGLSRSARGSGTPSPVAQALFKKLNQQYELHLELNPEDYHELSNWAFALTCEAERTLNDDEARRLLRAANEKYHVATTINSNYMTFDNWAWSLSIEAARTRDDSEGRRLLHSAREKYQEAIAIKSDAFNTLYNWGSNFATEARRTRDVAEARELLRAAREKYQAAVSIKPDFYEALSSWGRTLIAEARRADTSDARTTLLAAAEEVLGRAGNLRFSASFDLACLMALSGRPDEARCFLYECWRYKTLPSEEHLLANPDLASLRDQPWFAHILSLVRAEI